MEIPNRTTIRRRKHLTLEERLAVKQERNKAHAAASRERKKAQFDELQARVRELEAENARLRDENEYLKRGDGRRGE
jgi:predicted nuclease with TOPRIM domain